MANDAGDGGPAHGLFEATGGAEGLRSACADPRLNAILPDLRVPVLDGHPVPRAVAPDPLVPVVPTVLNPPVERAPEADLAAKVRALLDAPER